MMGAASSTRERLESAAQQLHVTLTEGQCEQLLGYVSQLQRWNRHYNLTALRDPEQMLVQHLFDSLAIVAPLRSLLPDPDTDALIVDVGSGAGLPGAVIAAVCPAWRVVCVDAVEKKTAFVTQVAGALKLPNLMALHGRIEAQAPMQADVVTSRAFASLLDFATLAGPHVRAGGWLAAMKGREPADEIQAVETYTPWRVRSILPLAVPELDAQRCLVTLSHQGTP